MRVDDVLRLAARFSVAQMMAHETFRARVDAGTRLSLHELLYPLLQAHDSVEIGADVEIGGSDQLFNCLCGRDLQRAIGTDPQVVVTVPLLRGTDGRKMSKSFGNHIPVDLRAPDVVGRTMSMPDEQIEELVALATDWDAERRADTVARLRAGDTNPRDVKLDIARSIATQLQGAQAAAPRSTSSSAWSAGASVRPRCPGAWFGRRRRGSTLRRLPTLPPHRSSIS